MNNPASRSTITWLLLVTDVIGLLICFNLAFLLRLEKVLDWKSPILYVLILLYLLGFYLADTYKLEKQVAGLWTSERVLLSILATVAAITSCIYLSGLWGSDPIVGRGILLISVALFTIWAISWRLATGKWIKTKEEQSRFLILGTGEKAISFGLEYLTAYPKAEFIFLTDKETAAGKYLLQDRNSFQLDPLEKFTYWSKQSWSGVLIDDTVDELSDDIVREVMEMRLRGVYVYNFADFYEIFWQKIPPAYIKDDWFAFTSGFSILHSPVNAKLKQIFDSIAAGFLLLITLPILILVAIAIKLDSSGSIFYSQLRTGLHGKKFKVHKFRSMYENAEYKGIQWAKEKDPRVTRVGRFLRLMRIDELPQLWNVLKGDMSLIGPRPERPEFDAQLRQKIPYYDVRYLVKPGITGWAQVCYPYGASIEDSYQKVAYDLYYIKKYSLLLDISIALKTIRVILLGKGR
jgi:exopolysaccharide biosynthesis polyprenyl glycosylphosphotransferase